MCQSSPGDRESRELDVVGSGPCLDPPRPLELAEIVQRARCILWSADVEGRGDWQRGEPDWKYLRWSPRVACEAAAQALLPLEIKPGSNYFEAWRDSRHRGDDRRMWETAFHALVSGAPGYHQVFRCYDKTGREHWMFEEVSITSSAPGLWHTVGVASDITPHYEAVESVRRVTTELEDAVQRQEASSAVLEVLLDSVPLGVALLSREGRFVRVNQEFCRLTAVSESTFQGQPLTRWIEPALAALLSRSFEEALSQGRRVNNELSLQGQVGLRHWAISVCPMQLAKSHAFAASIVICDVTEQRQSQEMRIAKEVAEAANAAKDRFLATLSHELRMPLTPVLAISSQFGQEAGCGEELREKLRVIHRNVELEARLIDDLLDLTRISRGRLALNRERCDVAELLRGTAATYRSQFESRGLMLKLEIEAPRAVLEADPLRLRQVILNLLGNAMKFTPRGGSVWMRCGNVEREGRWALRIEVADTGIGISAAAMRKVFEPFEQSQELGQAQRQAGLGLGLAISRSLVELHGGELVAESEGLGRGAVFRLTLPGAEPAGPQVQAASSALQAEASARILLVEDHADTATVLKALLQRMRHQVTTAGSVAEARRWLAEADFDVLVSDLGLPDGSGLEVMEACRGRVAGIALSGFCSEEDVRRCSEAGFVEHLAKPLTMDRLQAAIQRGLQGRAVGDESGSPA